MSSKGSAPDAGRFSEKELKKIENSEKEQRIFGEWVMQSNDFSEDEKSAIQYDTFAKFNDYWTKLIDAKSEPESSHDKGFALRSKRRQIFASTVKSFMDEFWPFLQIIKDFGAPYGGVALGVISVLFVVANNKDKTEGSFAATISGMKDRLPAWKLYQHMYNDDRDLDIRLKAKIVSVYESFIQLSIATTRNYKTGGPRRFMRALAGSEILKTQGDEIQSLIVDVRHLCEELLDKNLDATKRLNIQQATDIKALEVQIEQLQATNENLRLNEIQQLLKLNTFSEEERAREIQNYRRTLDESLDAEQFEQMREGRLRRFEASDTYRTWFESDQACLLVLSGYNERSILDQDQCWLSPIALNHIEYQLKPNHAGVGTAYQLLQQKGETLVHHVIPSILLQLLRQKRQALRDEKEHAELYAEVKKYEGLCNNTTKNDVNENDKIAMLQNFALRVVNFFEDSEVVYIIVDRVDRCMDPRGADHRMALMKVLVRMVEAAKCHLKILAVINGYDWRVEERRDEFGAEKEGTLIIHTERQCRLDSES